MKVYAIGYEQDPSGTRIAALLNENPTMQLIDCRFNPHSWRETWCKTTLMEQWGERYHWAGAYLGNAKHPSNQMFPGLVEIELINPRVGMRGLCSYLREGCDLILLCKCLEYRYCHLHEVVRLLSAAMPEVEVVLAEQPSYEPQYQFPSGSKVYVDLRGKRIPAIVLESRWSSKGNYDEVKLRVAAYNELTQAWMVSNYARPVQSYKLTKRDDMIPGLDEVPHDQS